MIPKAEILSVARNRGLLTNVVEKDYVVGCLLMGIAQHPLLNKWAFKGGTCLKKCFFETYRFSEDLDFTVPEGLVYDAHAYREALIECTASIAEETGIQFPEEGIEVTEQSRFTSYPGAAWACFNNQHGDLYPYEPGRFEGGG